MKIILYALLLLCTGPLLAAGNIEYDSDQTTSHTGVGSSEKEACAMAQSSASEDKRVAGPCTCEIRNKKNICYADSTKARSRSVTVPSSKAQTRPTAASENQSGAKQLQSIKKDFTFGGRTVSCEDAVKYRDSQLYMGMGSALESFDTNREQRRQTALAKFDADLAELTKDLDGATSLARKRILVAVAGVAIGHAAGRIAVSGASAGASAIEKQGLKILADRSADWISVFMKYRVDKKIDVVTVVAMPMTVLLALSPAAPIASVWAFGNAGIDIASAIGERELVRGEGNAVAAIIRKRAHDLVAKLQMPKIAALNAFKNEIDAQCK